MTRANALQAAINAGELSPRMAARVDFAKYAAAGSVVRNLLPVAQGALTRRPGTRYVAAAKSSSVRPKLFRFQFSTEQAYTLEGGDNVIRFYRNQGRIAVSNVATAISNGTFPVDLTGWTDDDAGSGASTHDATNFRMSLASGGTTAADIAARTQTVTVGASDQSVEHVLAFRVLGAPGDYILLNVGTSSGGGQLVNDRKCAVGWHVVPFTPGAGTIYVRFKNKGDDNNVYTSQNKTIQIDDVSFLDNAPLELTTPWTAAVLREAVFAQSTDTLYIYHGDYPTYKLERRGHSNWSLVEVAWEDGPWLDENVTATTFAASATTGSGVTITASALLGVNGGLGFQSTDVGRLVRLRHTNNEVGWGIITSITSTLIAVIDVRRAFNATTATATWRLGSWSATTGYPSCGTFFKQRLYAAGTTDKPQTFWASQSADLENMRPDSFVSAALTAEDDDGFDFTIAADEANTIAWMSPGLDLLLGTSGGVWVANSSGAVITPSDIDVVRHIADSCTTIQPLRAGRAALFLQRGLRKIREAVSDFQANGYVSVDLTILADHVTRGGVQEMAFQQQPDSHIWAVRADGVLAALCYKREDDVVGWSRHVIGGAFGSGNAVVESVACIPGNNGSGQVADSTERDEVWLAVKRTINGSTVRYIEVMEGMAEMPLRDDYSTAALHQAAILAAQKNVYYADCCITYSGSPATSITGLSHLEGQTVKVLADGAIHPDCTVSSGAITLQAAASIVQIGLGYEHVFQSLKAAVGGSSGTAVAKKKRIDRVGFIVLDAATFDVGPGPEGPFSTVDFREVANAMDTAVPLFSGEQVEKIQSNWELDPRIYLKSSAPAPFTLLALAPEVTTNDRI